MLRVLPRREPAWCRIATLFVVTATLHAQCDLSWQAGAASAGPDGTIRAVVPLPNGDVVAAGTFRVADDTVVDNIARWDGTAWRTLGGGTNGSVFGLVRRSSGALVAGGAFSSVGGVACSGIAQWNGTTWAPLGAGLNGTVRSVLELANGTLVAAGSFQFGGAGDTVAAWNGATWSPLGAGTGEARALVQLPNGDLVAGGSFTGAAFTAGLRRWNGTTWLAIAGLDVGANAVVDDLVLRSNGDLVLNGSFRIGGAAQNLAAWNGTAMTPMPMPMLASAGRALLARANGDLLLGGTPALFSTVPLARWAGTAWQAITGSPSRIECLAEDAGGRLVLGVTAPPTFPRPATVIRFDGVTWQELAAPLAPFVHVMADLPDGSVVAGGSFQQIGGTPASNVARWLGGAWVPLAAGTDGPVTAVAVEANGAVLVGGAFTQAGGMPAIAIARWDGQTWSPLGAGLPPGTPANGTVRAIAAAGNGDVLVARDAAGILRFDGAQWTTLIPPVGVSEGHAMVTRSNGDVVIGGSFGAGGGQVTGIQIYSNGALSPSPGAPQLVTSMLRTADDGVVVTGQGVQRWDGANWSALASAYIYDFAQLPTGDLVAVGPVNSLGGGAASCIYRLRPNGWQSWGDVTGGGGRALVATRDGNVLVSGSFLAAGSRIAYGFAQAAPGCPATTSVAGFGCAGGAGPVALLPVRDAWLGTTFTAVASGMTGNALALQVLGVAAQTPALPLPSGAPGCTLWVAPLLTDVLVPTAGQATVAFSLPMLPALVGQQLHAQVLGLEFGVTGLQQVTGSNALVATIGSL